MPRLAKLPTNATPLWRWMEEHDVTVARLAKRLDCTANYLGDVRRGVHRPSDALKLAIEYHTKDIERRAGVKKPRGVAAVDWFKAPAAKKSAA